MIDEGYIKFDCHWTQSPALAKEEIEALNNCRQKLYDRHLVGAYDNGIGFGNVSQRKEELQFLISGSTTGNFPVLDESHYAVVTAFDIEQNAVHCEGPIRASSESMSHAVIYQHCEEVNAVLHVHHLEMWQHYLHQLPTTSEAAPYGSPEMANEIIRLLNSTTVRTKEKCFVMAGHREGIFAFGTDLADATSNLLHFFDAFKAKR